MNAHPDDIAVEGFALVMKHKMAASRQKGRAGWDDPALCSAEDLARMLVEHLSKGNNGTFVDVANFAMMLHQRAEDPAVLAEALEKYQPVPHAVKPCGACTHGKVLIDPYDGGTYSDCWQCNGTVVVVECPTCKSGVSARQAEAVFDLPPTEPTK